MDGQTRKRKMEDEEEEEESEEEKMEKFFALIRSTREVHERIMGRTLVRPKENGEKKKKKPNDEKANGWKPSFQPQDFMGDDARLKTINIHHGRSLLPGPSKKKEDENKEKHLMVDTQMRIMNIDQNKLLPGPSEKREEDEEKDNSGDGLDLDLKL